MFRFDCESIPELMKSCGLNYFILVKLFDPKQAKMKKLQSLSDNLIKTKINKYCQIFKMTINQNYITSLSN